MSIVIFCFAFQSSDNNHISKTGAAEKLLNETLEKRRTNGIHHFLIADTFHLGYFWSCNGHLLCRGHHCGETSSPENAK